MSATINTSAVSQPQANWQEDRVISLSDRIPLPLAGASKAEEKLPVKDRPRQDESDTPSGKEVAILPALAEGILQQRNAPVGGFGNSGAIPVPATEAGTPSVVSKKATVAETTLSGDAPRLGDGARHSAGPKRVMLWGLATHGTRDATSPQGLSVTHDTPQGAPRVRYEAPSLLVAAPSPPKAGGEHVPKGGEMLPARHTLVPEPAPLLSGSAVETSGNRRGSEKRATEPASAEPLPMGRQVSAALSHEGQSARTATPTRPGTAPATPSRSDLAGFSQLAKVGGTENAGATELTYSFQSWGDGHVLKAQIAAQGAVMLNTSSARVNNALAMTRAESIAETTWRIDATEASGDDDAARKRRRSS